MEDLEMFVRYMTLKELKEIRVIIDKHIATKENQIKLIKAMQL